MGGARSAERGRLRVSVCVPGRRARWAVLNIGGHARPRLSSCVDSRGEAARGFPAGPAPFAGGALPARRINSESPGLAPAGAIDRGSVVPRRVPLGLSRRQRRRNNSVLSKQTQGPHEEPERRREPSESPARAQPAPCPRHVESTVRLLWPRPAAPPPRRHAATPFRVGRPLEKQSLPPLAGRSVARQTSLQWLIHFFQ